MVKWIMVRYTFTMGQANITESNLFPQKTVGGSPSLNQEPACGPAELATLLDGKTGVKGTGFPWQALPNPFASPSLIAPTC